MRLLEPFVLVPGRKAEGKGVGRGWEEDGFVQPACLCVSE